MKSDAINFLKQEQTPVSVLAETAQKAIEMFMGNLDQTNPAEAAIYIELNILLGAIDTAAQNIQRIVDAE